MAVRDESLDLWQLCGVSSCRADGGRYEIFCAVPSSLFLQHVLQAATDLPGASENDGSLP